MAKALKTIGVIVAGVALVATGVGAVAGAIGLSAAAAGTIGTIATVATIASGAIGIISALTAKKPSFTSGGNPQRFQTNPQSGLPYNMGRTRFSGIQIHGDTQQSSGSKVQDILSFAVLLSCGGAIEEIEAFKADNVAYTFDGSGQATGSYSGYMALRNSLGEPGASALTLSLNGSSFPSWTTNHKLSGMAHALWQLRYDKDGEKFTAGPPEPQWIGKWVKCYDPRLDSTYPGGTGSHRDDDETTWEWTRNGALHALTWAIGRHQNGKRTVGIGAPIENIRVADFVEAANIADTNNWYCGGTVYSTDSKWTSFKAMLQAAGAVPTMSGAMIGCRVFTPRISVTTINSEDLLDGLTITTTKSRRERINTAIPRYRSEDHEWEIISGTPVSDSSYVTADGGVRSREIDMPLVQHEVGQGDFDGNDQAGQLAAYEVANSREAGPIVGTVGPEFIGLKSNDAVTLNVPEEGLVNQLCILLEVSLDPTTGKITFAAETETTAKHSFALGETTTPPPAFSLTPPDLKPGAPSDSIWTPTATTMSNGLPTIAIVGAFEDAGSSALVVRHKRSVDSNWQVGAVVDAAGGTITHTLGPLNASTGYDVEIAYRNDVTQSDWTDIGPVTTSGSTLVQVIADAATAQSTADGKIDSFYQSSTPTGDIGDLWFKTDTGKWYIARSNGSNQITTGEWELTEDSDIGTAISNAAGAQTTADGAVANAATAQATADGKVTTFYSSSTPTAEGVGDLWYNTDTLLVTRWDGASWVSIDNGATRNEEIENLIPNAVTYTGYYSSAPATCTLEELTPTAGTIRDWRRVRCQANSTAQSFFINGGATEGFFSVREGETLYTQWESFRDESANGDAWLLCGFYAGDGSLVSNIFGNSANGSTALQWNTINNEITVPDNAAFCLVRFYFNSNFTAGTQYAASAYLGRAQLGSDVTSSIEGKTLIPVEADWQGNLKAGQDDIDCPYELQVNGVNLASSAAWSTTNPAGGTFTVGASTGIVNIADLTQSTDFVLTAIYNGKTRKKTITAQLNLDPPPVLGNASGSDTTLTAFSTNTLTVVSNEVEVTGQAGGLVDVQVVGALSPVAEAPIDASIPTFFDIQESVNGGSWTTIGTGEYSGPTLAVELEPPYIAISGNVNQTINLTGRTLGDSLKYRTRWRVSDARTIIFNSNARLNVSAS